MSARRIREEGKTSQSCLNEIRKFCHKVYAQTSASPNIKVDSPHFDVATVGPGDLFIRATTVFIERFTESDSPNVACICCIGIRNTGGKLLGQRLPDASQCRHCETADHDIPGALVTLAANSVSLLAGGTVTALAMTLRWMHRLGVNVQGASLAGTLPYVFNNLVLLVSSLFGLVYLLINHELSRLQAVFFAVITLLFLSIFVIVTWALRHRAQLIRIVHYMGRKWAALRHRSYDSEKAESAIKQLFDAWRHLRTRGWIKPLAGASLNIGFDMLTLYILFGAFGHSVSLGVLFVGYGLPLLFGKVGFLPGGLGIVEGTMAVLYRGFGVPNPILVVVILAYRLLSFWLPTLLGFSLIPYLNK